ncbi:hypothetical protein M080_2177 [Bacteroides fragilis str. 3397 T10]|nr:hypothetical protein M080_2177 [Bacteroides fragilis str. 3397 T10]
MKHVLYTLLLCALFQGCGSSKSVREKTDRRIMSDSLVEIKGNFERREGEIRTDSAGDIRQARQDRIVVMFDTGKPGSSQTGLPPVKQISFTGTALHEELGSTAAVHSFQSRRADSSLLLRTHREEENRKELRTDRKTAPGPLLRRIALPAGLIVGAYLLLRMLCKRLPEIKALWKRIFKG